MVHHYIFAVIALLTAGYNKGLWAVNGSAKYSHAYRRQITQIWATVSFPNFTTKYKSVDPKSEAFDPQR